MTDWDKEIQKMKDNMERDELWLKRFRIAFMIVGPILFVMSFGFMALASIALYQWVTR